MKKLYGIKSVSYTHLDVYKRQVPSEQYGDRYACVKVEVRREKPVRHELGMVVNENLDAAPVSYTHLALSAGGCVPLF